METLLLVLSREQVEFGDFVADEAGTCCAAWTMVSCEGEQYDIATRFRPPRGHTGQKERIWALKQTKIRATSTH